MDGIKWAGVASFIFNGGFVHNKRAWGCLLLQSVCP